MDGFDGLDLALVDFDFALLVLASDFLEVADDVFVVTVLQD